MKTIGAISFKGRDEPRVALTRRDSGAGIRGVGMSHGRVMLMLLGRMLLIVFGVMLSACKPAVESGAPGELGDGSTNGSTHRATMATRSGEVIAEACLLCHSTREMQRGPILDGLPQWYGELQLRKFMDGVRGGNPDNRSEALMAAGTTALRTPAEAAAAAAFFSRLPVQNHLRTVRGDADRGRQLYETCVGCHGPAGQGNPLVKGPPLNVQEDWYLLDQMRKFRSGARGSHPRDMEGQMMRVSVQALGDKDCVDVIAYVAGF